MSKKPLIAVSDFFYFFKGKYIYIYIYIYFLLKNKYIVIIFAVIPVIIYP